MTTNNPMPPPSQKLTASSKMEEPWYRYFSTDRLAQDSSNSFPVINVKDMGALGDGSANDTAAFVAAFAELATTGGTIYVPSGVYMVDPDTLQIGNGTNAAVSTINGISLTGDASTLYFDIGSIIKARAAGTTLLTVAGTIGGIRIENIKFDCDDVCQRAWTLYSCLECTFRNFNLVNFTAYGMFCDCRTGPVSAANWASHNVFERFLIYSESVVDFGAGIYLNGSFSDNWDWFHNTFINGSVQLNNGAVSGTRGIDLRFCDSNTWIEVDCSSFTGAGIGGGIAVNFDGSSSSLYPQNNFFYGCSLKNTFVSGTISRNYFANFCTRDAETVPTSTYLIGWTDQGDYFGQHTFNEPVVAKSTSATVAGGAKAYLIGPTTNNFGIWWGSGAPTTTAAQGSLYLRTDGSSTASRAYINTAGTTVWTALITAA
jgi:hypothetical protein